jgi:oligoribonuclease NrnB/cAMP/cGMP phosphodiesterase (DHH superfamily)
MKDFLKHINNIRHATEKEKNNELWDLEGVLKKSNQLLKFDTRPVSKFKDEVGKIVRVKSKADKIVFKDNNNYILIDLEELNNYVKKHKLKKVYLKNIIKKLEWNVIL